MITIPLAFSRAVTLAIRRGLLALLPLIPIGAVTPAGAATPDEIRCGILNPPGQYGPYDYRTAGEDKKSLVELPHFSAENEMLIKGTSQLRPGPDIDYTLRAFPNHPRALKSMMELGFKEKSPKPFGARWTVDCYFNRALRMAPDDPQVRMVYGIFLLRIGEKKAAVEQLEFARSNGLSSGNFQYNLGLAYFQVQDYEKARQQAYKAREMGYDLEGLKNLLTRAGQWKDPPAKVPESTDPKAPAPAPASTEPQTPAVKN